MLLLQHRGFCKQPRTRGYRLPALYGRGKSGRERQVIYAIIQRNALLRCCEVAIALDILEPP
jgi:hypothetical protein